MFNDFDDFKALGKPHVTSPAAMPPHALTQFAVCCVAEDQLDKKQQTKKTQRPPKTMKKVVGFTIKPSEVIAAFPCIEQDWLAPCMHSFTNCHSVCLTLLFQLPLQFQAPAAQDDSDSHSEEDQPSNSK